MPELKVPTEVYSRVVGYYRPESQANRGKRAEMKDRTKFTKDQVLNAVQST